MKHSGKYLFLIISILATLTGCNKDTTLSPELSAVHTLMKESVLLKSTVLEGSNWILNFETESVSLPAEGIQSITPDPEQWNTLVTFADGSTLNIPTIGPSIDNLIRNTELNPSGYNPLSAGVLVYLPALGHIKVIIHSKPGNKEPDIQHLCSSVERGQTVKILGLYPDYNNQIELIYTDRKGNERARSFLNIQTKKLDIDHLPKIKVVKVDRQAMEPGLNLVNSPGHDETDTSCPYMVDSDGEIRWLLDWRNSKDLQHIGAQCGLHRMENGNYITGDANNDQLVEVNVLGEIIRCWDLKAMGYKYHHEISPTKNGHFLVAVSNVNAKIASGKNVRILDHVIEFNPQDGTISKTWDLVNILDSARYTINDPEISFNILGATPSNWAHNNGIAEYGDEILGSARFQGIFKYDYNGKLKWIISPHKNWRDQYKSSLLQPLDKNGNPITDPAVIAGDKCTDDFDWVWGVHNPVMMPNGHILAFDNGFTRHYDSDAPGSYPYSRIVEYEIDEKNMTIRQVWQYGKERRECYANAVSSVQYLEKTGNALFCPGVGNTLSDGGKGARIIEINTKTQEAIFEMEFSASSPIIFHRANRMSLYPENL